MMIELEAHKKLEEIKVGNGYKKICGVYQSTFWYTLSVCVFVLIAVTTALAKGGQHLSEGFPIAPLDRPTVAWFEKTNPAPSVTVHYYGAKWCGPCKKLKPILKGLEKEGYEIKFHDIDQEPRPRDVTVVPTLKWFKFGKFVESQTGLRTKAELKAKFEEIEGSIF